METSEGVTTTLEYRYDLAGRLVEVKQDGVVTESYEYDANGNRVQALTSSPGVVAGNYDDQERLIESGGKTYTYTANGELLTKTSNGQTTTYHYEVLGNLRQVQLPEKTLEYVIDGRNRRVGKKVNGTLVQGWLYQGSLKPIAELDGNGNVVARFVYGSKANVPDYLVKEGKTYRLISEHLGSPRSVVDLSDGSVAQRLEYDVFGNVTTDTNPGFQPFGFAGGLYDSETRLVRFGARDYDAESGRWTAKDPMEFDGDGTNLYEYVESDPIQFIDLLGQSKVQGQKNIGADDPLTSGLNKNTLKPELDDGLAKIEEVLKTGEHEGQKLSPKRRTYLKGFLKVAKRGFTPAYSPPFLEDLVMMVSREACLRGDMGACGVFEWMGGEITNPCKPES